MDNLIKIIQLLKDTDAVVLVSVVCLFALYVVLSCVNRLTQPKKPGK